MGYERPTLDGRPYISTHISMCIYRRSRRESYSPRKNEGHSLVVLCRPMWQPWYRHTNSLLIKVTPEQIMCYENELNICNVAEFFNTIFHNHVFYYISCIVFSILQSLLTYRWSWNTWTYNNNNNNIFVKHVFPFMHWSSGDPSNDRVYVYSAMIGWYNSKSASVVHWHRGFGVLLTFLQTHKQGGEGGCSDLLKYSEVHRCVYIGLYPRYIYIYCVRGFLTLFLLISLLPSNNWFVVVSRECGNIVFLFNCNSIFVLYLIEILSLSVSVLIFFTRPLLLIVETDGV